MGKRNCIYCKGLGSLPCTSCRGTGRDKEGDVCPLCDKGYVECATCDGTGQVDDGEDG